MTPSGVYGWTGQRWRDCPAGACPLQDALPELRPGTGDRSIARSATMSRVLAGCAQCVITNVTAVAPRSCRQVAKFTGRKLRWPTTEDAANMNQEGQADLRIGLTGGAGAEVESRHRSPASALHMRPQSLKCVLHSAHSVIRPSTSLSQHRKDGCLVGSAPAAKGEKQSTTTSVLCFHHAHPTPIQYTARLYSQPQWTGVTNN